MWPSWDDFGNITWAYSRWKYPSSDEWLWLDSANISFPNPNDILSPLPFLPGTYYLQLFNSNVWNYI